ncbi:uncharacterized protein LOC106163938 [Lingula anatina]|uniref:Uncharacterized protein LOC106163938 n=1 Tax=Lingula anatina TaxID=7574 RepID=A0A1S3IFW9_LINAN|nr:uncharacterized protein LOC106163938 [Lingula anatina]|eukprot:XP_013397112.1 uncharacterized protein LOC106163938 [Lingula anatina]
MAQFVLLLLLLATIASPCCSKKHIYQDTMMVGSPPHSQRKYGKIQRTPADRNGAEVIRYIGGDGIPDSYIVKLKAGLSRGKALDFTNALKAEMTPTAFGNTRRGRGPQIGKLHEVGEIKFLTIETTDKGLARLRRQTDVVDVIYQDTYVYADGCACLVDCQNKTEDLGDKQCWSYDTSVWGLDRIDQTTRLPNGKFNVKGTGSDVDVYIFDTGVYAEHQQFLREDNTSRVTFGNKADATWSDTDIHGHGTHVAGTVGGITTGVAKNVNLINVKVLGDQGYGYRSGILAMLEWVRDQVNVTKRKSIINMSLGGVQQDLYDDLVNTLVTEAGIVVVVAAGNDNSLASFKSPANAEEAITVGATWDNDDRAYFSNFGPRVDIWAPGRFILSAHVGSPYSSALKSGTSMASPMVAGAAAAYMSTLDHNPTPAEVRQHLIATSMDNVVTNIPEKYCYKVTISREEGCYWWMGTCEREICLPGTSVTRLLNVGCDPSQSSTVVI